jgi:hypothetical protein
MTRLILIRSYVRYIFPPSYLWRLGGLAREMKVKAFQLFV